jgi:hypothetical protein
MLTHHDEVALAKAPRVDEYERLWQQLIPIGVYANGRLPQIEFATEDELEAADRQSKMSL